MAPSENAEIVPKRTRARWIGAGAATLALAAVAFGLLRPAPQSTARPEAPDFELPVLGGGGSISSNDLRGKPLVINFWASWCGPCREEAPELEAAWQKYGDRVQFLGVDTRDAEPAALDFVEEFDLTYPMVRDEDQVLVEAMELVGLPQTFFITEDWRILGSAAGKPVGNALGAISAEDLEARIEELLAHRTESPVTSD